MRPESNRSYQMNDHKTNPLICPKKTGAHAHSLHIECQLADRYRLLGLVKAERGTVAQQGAEGET